MAYTAGTLSSCATTYRKDGNVERLYTFTSATELANVAKTDIIPSIDVSSASAIWLQNKCVDRSSGVSVNTNVITSLDDTNFTVAAAGNLILDTQLVDETWIGAVTASTYGTKRLKLSAVGVDANTLDCQYTILVVQPF